MRKRVEEARIPACDGFPLAATVFRGGGKGWVIINSATGVKRGYYLKYAGYLQERGFSVVAYDYRGIGGSRPAALRGFPGRMSDWGIQDFNGILEWIAAQEGGAAPTLVVGHSFGGQALAFVRPVERVRGLLAVAVQSGFWGHWKTSQRLLLGPLWYVAIPTLTTLLGFLPSRVLGMGEDLPEGVAREWSKWCRSRHYLMSFRETLPIQATQTFSGPILSLTFSDDFFCPAAAAAGYLTWFPRASTEIRLYTPQELGEESLGHFAFFRSKFRESLWAESADWLESLARSPS